jgi:predicted ATPase
VSGRVVKVAITGTHSTGKSTFLNELEPQLEGMGLKVARIGDIARAAVALGFPILRDHTFESTLWIIEECMRRETAASLGSDVILVDRPVIDALGYLRAALRLTGRQISPRQVEALATIVETHAPEYDVLIEARLDENIPLGPGRDEDSDFRKSAASHIQELVSQLFPSALHMTASNRVEVLDRTFFLISGLRTPR